MSRTIVQIVADLKKHYSKDLTKTRAEVIEAIQVLAATDHSGYQTKEDNTLTTTSKTVVGAINELNTAVGGAFPAANIAYDDASEKLQITIGEKSYVVACSAVN